MKKKSNRILYAMCYKKRLPTQQQSTHFETDGLPLRSSRSIIICFPYCCAAGDNIGSVAFFIRFPLFLWLAEMHVWLYFACRVWFLSVEITFSNATAYVFRRKCRVHLNWYKHRIIRLATMDTENAIDVFHWKYYTVIFVCAELLASGSPYVDYYFHQNSPKCLSCSRWLIGERWQKRTRRASNYCAYSM